MDKIGFGFLREWGRERLFAPKRGPKFSIYSSILEYLPDFEK